MARKKKLHASGLVEYKATVGKGIDGKRLQKSFYGTSKLEARRKANDYIKEQEIVARTGEINIKREYTFAEWSKKWLETKKGSVKNSTYENTYKVKLEKYLMPYFGDARLIDIRQVDVQTFFNNYSSLSKSTHNKLKIILKAVFDSAIYNDLCHKNPVKNIKISSVESDSRRTYTTIQRDKLLDYCISSGDIDIVIFLETGIRRSEMLGLMWDDFDFAAKTMHVARAVTPDSNGSVIGKPKTKTSDQVLPISDILVDALKPYYSMGKFVLGGNSFIDASNYGKRFNTRMANIAVKLDIPELTPHELRHTYGTLLRERGVDIYTIQRLMGHSEISTTAKVYVHNDIEVLRKALF